MTILKRFLVCAGLAWLAVACARAETVPVAQCIERVALERGKSCGKPDSYDVRLRNRCAEEIDMKFCLRRKNGTWSCGMQFRHGQR